jgi:hypothetical protein
MASSESLNETDSRSDTPTVRRASKKLEAIKESGKKFKKKIIKQTF